MCARTIGRSDVQMLWRSLSDRAPAKSRQSSNIALARPHARPRDGLFWVCMHDRLCAGEAERRNRDKTFIYFFHFDCARKNECIPSHVSFFRHRRKRGLITPFTPKPLLHRMEDFTPFFTADARTARGFGEPNHCAYSPSKWTPAMEVEPTRFVLCLSSCREASGPYSGHPLARRRRCFEEHTVERLLSTLCNAQTRRLSRGFAARHWHAPSSLSWPWWQYAARHRSTTFATPSRPVGIGTQP